MVASSCSSVPFAVRLSFIDVSLALPDVELVTAAEVPNTAVMFRVAAVFLAVVLPVDPLHVGPELSPDSA